MLNTIVLMAGRGTRVADIDPNLPKPLLPILGRPLIEWVVRNVKSKQLLQKFIFICLEEHVRKFGLQAIFESLGIDFEIVIAPSVTEGAACSALLASAALVDGDLVIMNSDQFVYFDYKAFVDDSRRRDLDGSLVTMKATGSKWSFVRLNELEKVVEVREKKEISNEATVGFHYFKSWTLFESSLARMMEAKDMYNGEFYLAPVYNYLGPGANIGHYPIGAAGKDMVDLGTKESFLQALQDSRFINELRMLIT